ncbi:3-hydroxyacyl-CoA dehydrogenase, partial [Bosea sp. CRIB-10]
MPTVTLARHGDVAVASLDHPPVNALAAALRSDLLQALTRAMADG